MKSNIIAKLLLSCMIVGALSACKNGDAEFDDYEGGTSVYFAKQYPVRTLILGYDENDNTLDNNYQCQIMSTMGGSYSGANIKVQIAVDESLCDNLYFEDGETPVKPMPQSYYTLSTNTLDYAGSYMGRTTVTLTDAFFADPEALTTTYVIPLVMTSQTGAGRIITGTPKTEGESPSRTNSSAWDVLPMDYTLYCIKYINPYEAYWACRGSDNITIDGASKTVTRHHANVEDDEVCSTTSASLKSVTYPVTVTKTDGSQLTCQLLLTFNDNGECTISSNTDGMTASGSGIYKDKSEKKAWADKDRDGLYLDYNINFGNGISQTTKDTLVWVRRGGVPTTFSPVYKAN